MQTKWKVITSLLVCLAVTIPAAFGASTLSGGPAATATGSGRSGGGTYQHSYTPTSPVTAGKGVEVGISAWAMADDSGTGSASASYTGSPSLTGSMDSTSGIYTDSVSAQVKNATVTASVDKVTFGGTASSGSAIYAYAEGNPNQDFSATVPILNGKAVINTIVGPVSKASTSVLGPNDPNGPASTLDFTGAGSASATASGQALFDASHSFKGTSIEALKIYGQIGSDSMAATADMYSSRTFATSGSSGAAATTGYSSIGVDASANTNFANANADHNIDLTANGETSSNDLVAKINGSSNTATAVGGAWDDNVEAAANKTKGFNEVSCASAIGNLFGSASSYKGDSTTKDIGTAKSEMIADAQENHFDTSSNQARSKVDYMTFSSAQRKNGLSSSYLVSGSANIGGGITDVKVQASSDTYTQIHADTGAFQNGIFGFNAGSKLNSGSSGTNNLVYAGEMFEASSDLFQTEAGLNPKIGTKFGTLDNTLNYNPSQGAKSSSSSNSAGSWAMIGNFFAKAVAPVITGSPFSTNWNHLYTYGWAQGGDKSTYVGAWTDGLTFTGKDASGSATGKIMGLDETIADQTARQYDRYIETSNQR